MNNVYIYRKMNSRERVLKAISHREPDRIPVFANLTPQMARKLSAHLGMPYEEPVDSLLSTRISHPRLLLELGNDCVGIAAQAPDDRPTTAGSDGILTNEWGMKFIPAPLYNEFHSYPLSHAETAAHIEEYPFPGIHAKGRFREAIKSVRKYRENYAIVADLETSIFETAWYLTGLEKLLTDMLNGAAYVEPLMDKIMEINVETGKELIRLGADVIWCGDDFGTQHGMIMDPDLWRAFFKPRIKKMFDEFRKVNEQIRIAWHSCGSIVPIIGDFVEIGLDILNPLQPKAAGMDPEYLKSEYGEDLTFFGAIDVQELLPYGTPEKTRDEVRRIGGILGKGGGCILAPAHNIQPDTPVENVLAMYEAVQKG